MTILDSEKTNSEGALSDRQAGDEARDAKEWNIASEKYGKYLDAVPSDAAIWVQLGHSLKEQEKLIEALSAYKRASALNPTDADVFLHIGHIHKLQNDRSRAVDAYSRASDLGDNRALEELIRLGNRNRSAKQASSIVTSRAGDGTIYLDVTDVLIYLHEHANVSGIQRVIQSIGLELCRSGDLLPGAFEFCILDRANDRFRIVPKALFKYILDKIKSAEFSDDQRIETIESCYGHSIIAFCPLDSLFIMGAFWVTDAYPHALMRVRESHVPIGVLIYDLIPISHPLLCDPGLARDFKVRAIQVLALVDYVAAISDFVAEEARAFISLAHGRSIPVTTLKLAHGDRTSSVSLYGDEDVRTIASTDYVLVVGTIEVRKNHKYLVQIWQQLINQLGEATVPDLVFVGRWGWRTDDLRHLLEETNYINGKVIVLSSVSDEDLHLLYRNCRFTAFPSIIEGWGLPIGESLMNNKVCVTSAAASMPEVGLDFCIYLDPLSVSSGLSVIRRLLTDNETLKAAEDFISRNFSPRYWIDVARDFSKIVTNGKIDVNVNDVFYTANPGELISFRPHDIELAGRVSLGSFAAPLSCREGLKPAGEFGYRIASNRIKIRFGYRMLAVTKSVLIMIHINAVSLSEELILNVVCGSSLQNLTLREGSRWYRLVVDSKEPNHIDIDIHGFKRGKGRDSQTDLFVTAFGFADVEDVGNRLSLLECVALW